jgi:hypothetical protein
MKKKLNKRYTMEKEYQTPAVRVMDLRFDASFCLSGGLEDTYDDEFDWDD